MNLSINSWPAAIVLCVAMVCVVALAGVVGWRSPASLAALAMLAAHVIQATLPAALSRRPAPAVDDPYADVPTTASPTLPPRGPGA